MTPERRAARGPRTGLEHDEARKIVGLRTQPVKTPRAAARPAEETVPGVHEQLRGPMVDLLPLHAPQEAELVRDPADVREQLGHRCAGFSVPLELPARAQELGARWIDEGESSPCRKARRQGLTVELLERRLGLVEFELTRAPAMKSQTTRLALGAWCSPTAP